MTLLRPWRREAGAGLMSFDKSVHLENHNLPHSGRGWKDIEHTNMMPTPGPHNFIYRWENWGPSLYIPFVANLRPHISGVA